MKIKSIALLLAIAAQSAVFGAGKATAWEPQPGYWYNDTDSVVEVEIFDPIVAATGKIKPIFLESHELTKMSPFKATEYQNYGGKRMVNFSFGKRIQETQNYVSGSRNSAYLTQELLGNRGNYVILFKNVPQLGLSFSVLSEKEFTERFAKELENLPLPGGVQRMIGSYVLPEAEKPQAKE